jgi:alpha-ribazole phosphatase
LRRCADVGRWLRRWGWTHRIDPRLIEVDFGTWDGRPWSDIGADDFAPWEADFLRHTPGGGESLAQVRERVRAVLAELADAHRTLDAPLLVVGHAGWINTLRTLHLGGLVASRWPAPVAYSERVAFAGRLLIEVN